MTDIPNNNRREQRRLERERRRLLRAQKRRHRILRSIAVLPSLVTVFNGLSGFAAIFMATLAPRDPWGEWGNLYIAAWFLVLAMVCDVLDGRLARLTRKTSDFGAQLDSLCDMVSFGVAPAMLMLKLVALTMPGSAQGLLQPGEAQVLVWCVGAVYVACAALRLARFNVENVPDESAHMNFRGLPSPGAAAAVMTLTMCACRVHEKGWPATDTVLSIVVPAVTLLTGLLMVSRLQYPHLVNQFIRGKRPFSYLVKFVLAVLAILVIELMTKALFVPAALALAYAFSGPTRWTWRKALGKTTPPAATPPTNPPAPPPT